jgi:hypothetical protein
MPFVVTLAVEANDLGAVLDYVLKNTRVKLLGCKHDRTSTQERPARTPRVFKVGPVPREGAFSALKKIVEEAYGIGDEFTPRSLLHITRRKMKDGTFYTTLKKLLDERFIEKRHAGLYARVK